MWYSKIAHKKDSWGYHLIIDASECNNNIRNKQKIIEFMDELIPAIDMIAVGEPMIKYFPSDGSNQGYSVLQFIETSSISCHFIENDNTLYLDVFSCKDFDVSDVVKTLKKYFSPGKIKRRFLYRDAKDDN